MKQLRATLLGGLIILASQVTWAAPVTGLYQVREPLQEQTQEARSEAFAQAFVTLMQRLTGSAQSAQHAALASHLATPENLALGYTYHEEELQVNFDPASVMQALREAGVPVWGNDRPVLLLWWVQDGLQGRNLLGDGQNRSMNLQQTALHRGLPIRFPLADLAEQVQADQGWSGARAEQISELLQRYGGDALLVVDAEEAAEQIAGRWQLIGGSQDHKGNLAGSNLLEAADGMFQTLAGQLAEEYAVVPGKGDRLQVRLQGLDMDGMLAAEKALQVFDCRLVAVQGSEALWEVTAMPEQLRSQLALYDFRERESFRDEGYEDAEEDSAQMTELVFTR